MGLWDLGRWGMHTYLQGLACTDPTKLLVVIILTYSEYSHLFVVIFATGSPLTSFARGLQAQNSLIKPIVVLQRNVYNL